MGFNHDDTKVRGDLFTESGKWKYTVTLDYTGGDWDYWDLWWEARQALRRATEAGTSGVTLKRIPDGWHLVVLEPYGRTSHPIIVHGGLEPVEEAAPVVELREYALAAA